ncbi:MAG: ABC transporter ATP-binding protein [Proteobacteria bacterium ST_bin12]|nr:MAG: ABC transporter ATP-binding protein [Proteobacteria bacterium ST_bin12]
MQSKNSLFNLISRLWQHMALRRRRQFGFLLIMMIIASFTEVFSIGAILPFLGVLTAPQKVFEHALAQPMINFLNLTSPEQLLLPLTVLFCTAVLTAGAMRLLLVWTTMRLSFGTGADISLDIYRRTLYQPYVVHVSRNSSEVINGITAKANIMIFGTLIPILTIISSLFMMSAILIAIVYVNPLIAFTAFGSFGLLYTLIIKLTRKRLIKTGECIAREGANVHKSLQEGLSGIRDVLIDGTQSVYCQIYRDSDFPMRRASGDQSFIGAAPRYLMESLGMLLIAVLAYILAFQPDGVTKAIPILGALALGSQRLLPVLQQTYASISSIVGSQASLRDALELLDQPLPAYVNQPIPKPLPFEQSINLNQLSFRYSSESAWVLNKIDISVAKGSRVGVIGSTGGGKSTMLDIVMGLLEPSEGSLEIDGVLVDALNRRAWQSHIAHVPQAIFLADTSIAENIAFGVPKAKIDYERVKLAAQQAQIADAIESWPSQYKTFVGERGIRLSGGQRQRIGIARALYKQADVIIFDEATSALDTETEQAVMQAIDNLSENLTIIIIAHRLTTLKNCSQIIELARGQVKQIGTYEQIIESHH